MFLWSEAAVWSICGLSYRNDWKPGDLSNKRLSGEVIMSMAFQATAQWKTTKTSWVLTEFEQWWWLQPDRPLPGAFRPTYLWPSRSSTVSTEKQNVAVLKLELTVIWTTQCRVWTLTTLFVAVDVEFLIIDTVRVYGSSDAVHEVQAASEHMVRKVKVKNRCCCNDID